MHYLTWQNSHWLYRIKGCFCELGVFGPPFICEILLLPGEYNPFLFFLCSSHKILLQGSLQQLPLLLWLWLAAWLVRGRTGRLAVGAASASNVGCMGIPAEAACLSWRLPWLSCLCCFGSWWLSLACACCCCFSCCYSSAAAAATDDDHCIGIHSLGWCEGVIAAAAILLCFQYIQ